MKKYSIIFILLFVSFYLNAADRWDSVVVDGHKRDYKVHVPKSYNKSTPVPLVLALHGGGGRARSMERLTKFSDLADKEGFIVVYPEGFEKQWNDGREADNIRAQKLNLDDVGFIGKVIDAMEERYNIDRKMIYATGISNGGFMCQRLACALSDRLAAVASVSATIPEKIKDTCIPKEKISVMFIHGTDDPLVPYNGGQVKVFNKERGAITSVKEAVDIWVKRDDCVKVNSDKLALDMEVDADYYRDKGNTEVVLYTIQGGGHTWPGGPQYMSPKIVGYVCKDFDATKVVWEFFKKHSK